MERRERHLETEPDQQEKQRERHQRIAGEVRPRQGSDLNAPGFPEQEDDAVEGERRAERAGQEILQAGLGGGLDRPEERGEHVERQGQGLQSDEHEEQIEAPRHERDTQVPPEQERVELPLLFAGAREVGLGHEHGHGRRGAQEEAHGHRQG